MNRLTILNQLEEDLKEIKSTRGYNFTPVEVARGLHKWNDFPVKPVIGFTHFRDEADEDADSGDIARWLYFYGYGYTETDGNGNTDDIHNLAQDFEDFLNSTDNTYTEETMIGDIEIKEGGVSDPVNAFIITFRILNCQ